MSINSPFQLSELCTEAHLRVLATSDLHMQLMPWDYYTDRPQPGTGLACTATLINEWRDSAANSLLLDNGDVLQGNPMADFSATEFAKTGQANGLMALAMNQLNYDGATLGNHEFNFGLDYLAASISKANYPIVSANIATALGPDPLQDTLLVKPYALVDKQITTGDGSTVPLRIGIIGFAPPQLTLWDRHVLRGALKTRDIVESARAYLPEMVEKGAEIIIALCHSGIGPATYEPWMEHSAVPLAAMPQIDALICGHTHRVFPGPGYETTGPVEPTIGELYLKPTVMPGSHGSHLGVIDLHLTRQDGKWHCTAHQAQVVPVMPPNATAAKIDPEIEKLATPVHNQVRDAVRLPIGSTAQPLHSFFSFVAPDLTMQLAATAMQAAAAPLIAGTDAAKLPLLCATSPLKSGGQRGPSNYIDIPTGPLALRHAIEMYVYPNTIMLLELSVADVRLWLERSASLFLQVTPGHDDQPLVDMAMPSYLYDVIYGITYEVDPSLPAYCSADGKLRTPEPQRIGPITYQGRVLAPEDRVVVITNSYRAGGSNGYSMLRNGIPIVEARQGMQSIITDYIRNAGQVRLSPQQPWRFKSLPETSAWFDSSPQALRFSAEMAQNRIEIYPSGPPLTDEGFARFTYHFS